MIAVIFEVEPAGAAEQIRYLEIAAGLKRRLEQVDGFISVERFESLATPGKFLSLSFFEDETALAAWRNTPEHRLAQAEGRERLFAQYRLRIARVMRDYGPHERDQAPEDSRRAHGPAEPSSGAVASIRPPSFP